MVKQRMYNLVELINYHNNRYYNDDNPEISDYEYDKLYKELVELEKAHPEYVLPDSPTRRVGTTPQDGKLRHSVPMLSLENSYNRSDVEKFITKILTSAEADIEFTVEPKMDGAAVSLTYANGMLSLAATRGDGITGEDITANMRRVVDLPATLPFKDELIVRGEVFMPRSVFDKLNQQRATQDLPPFANPRNAAAGSLKLLDQDLFAERGLTMMIYNVDSPTGHSSHWDDMAYCKSLGFPVNELNRLCHNLDEVLSHLDAIEKVRFSLPYDIDGAVIKVNSYAIRKDLGSTGKFPRWAVAYKYPAMQATTILKDVTFQVGRTGVVTPVAELEPVVLSGSTISRATLHNEDEIARLDVWIGDTVFIEKGGEIIPKVVQAVLDKRPTDARRIEFPKHCPSCGSELIKPEGEVRWRCISPNCKARVRGVIRHFASRDAMDIEGMGESIINALVDEGRFNEIADIYTLTETELAGRERMGKRSAANLIAAIEASRQREFSRVLFAIGLPQVGISMARILAAEFGDIDSLMAADRERLTGINDVGEKTADMLVQVFNSEGFTAFIGKLRATGLQMRQEASTVAAVNSPISGKTFLITGTLSRGRKEIEDEILSHGGKVAGSVTKTLDYLIAGEKAGSKLDKATKLGIVVIDEDEYLRLIGE